MAEELFDCHAHERTWLRDYGEIASLLDREGLLAHEREHRIEAEAQARAILSRDHDAARRVFDWLVERGRIDGDMFKRLMQGGA
jgi:hypothetical protein